MERIKLNKEELENHLQEQIEFLNRSCDSFDNGYYSEAKRISVVLRVLLHDTKASHSLLGQLDRKDIQFFNTSFPLDKESLSSHGGLVMIASKGKESRFVPMLDDVPFKRWDDFNDWWNEEVFIDGERNILKRKDLILISSNQDGGAHVDPALNGIYSKLSKDEYVGLIYQEGDSKIKIPQAAGSAIRQIAHEVLKTLFPDYEKLPKVKAYMFISTGTFVLGDKSTPIPIFKKVGRNEPCPCGSGKKYKKCHGKKE